MTADAYQQFLQRKLVSVAPAGLSGEHNLSSYALMPHQADLVAWAVKRGRAAVFADTGLGKTRVYQLEHSGDFPKHIKEGASSLWVESEVQAWIAERIRRAREPRAA